MHVHIPGRIISEPVSKLTLIQKCLHHLDPHGDVLSFVTCHQVAEGGYVLPAVEASATTVASLLGEGGWEQFIRNNIREGAMKADIQSRGLLIANLAGLQAILVAGRASQGPIGLLKSVGQHGELAAVAQRAGGTARASAVKTVVIGKLPFLQEMVSI